MPVAFGLTISEKKRVALSNGIILSALKELLKEAFGLDKKQRERAAEITRQLREGVLNLREVREVEF